MAGLTVTISAAEINNRLGTIAANVNNAIEAIQPAAQFLTQNPDPELIADYQLTQGDLNLLRAAYVDLDLLRRIYRGQDPLAVAQNFRTNVRRIIGLGFM